MREIQDLRIHGYRQLALGMIALFIVIALGRFAYTPILPFMQLDTGLDNKSVGLLATFNYLGYLIGAMLPIFYIMKNKVFDLKCYLLLNVATMLLFGVTDHFVIWSLLRLLNGISSGAVFVLASNIVLEALHLARREGIAGLLYSAVGLGLFSSSLFIFLYTDVTHWRETWIWLGSAAFILTLIIIICLRENPTLPEPASHKAHGPENVIRYSKKFYIPFAIAYFCEGAGYIITGTFLVAIVKTMPTLSEYAGTQLDVCRTWRHSSYCLMVNDWSAHWHLSFSHTRLFITNCCGTDAYLYSQCLCDCTQFDDFRCDVFRANDPFHVEVAPDYI